MKLIAATGNSGKLEEFQRIFAPLGIEVISQRQAGADTNVLETGTTFAENAQLKAEAIFQITGLPTLADDSGLCVDALGGRPGVYSARYCGEETGYPEKIANLLEEIKDVPDEKRTARFISHITCILDSDTVLQSEGVCEGRIGLVPLGGGGFGYDPIFYVGEKSIAELPGEEKDAISHRGQALRKLYKQLQNETTKQKRM